jgi:hypothetical protein
MARSTTDPQPRKIIRKLRHWKQRFDRDAAFVWRKALRWTDDVRVVPGEIVSEEILAQMGTAKLRRFWESGMIELAELENRDAWPEGEGESPPPAADVGDGGSSPSGDGDGSPDSLEDLPEGVSIKSGRGGWYTVTAGEAKTKVQGQAALEELIAKLRAVDTEE